MHTYLFQFGTTPDLSLKELQSLVTNTRVTKILPTVFSADLVDDAEALSLQDRLGGTVKIIKHITQVAEPTPENLLEVITHTLLSEQTTGKIVYAVAELGRDHLPQIDAVAIKTRLANVGRSSQYKDGSRYGLSAAVLLHKSKLLEIYIISNGEATHLGVTLSVQDIDDWTNRDRNKPYADSRKGMLPPKLARMMVNLGLGAVDVQNPVLLDPFCGSGTVLMEALPWCSKVFGADQDPDSVAGTRENLEWFTNCYELENTGVVLLSDATKVLTSEPVDLIVTEPFLGKPKPNPALIPNILRGLEKLYKGCFKNWKKLLKENGVVVMIFPKIEITLESGKTVSYDMHSFIDSLAEMGYTTTSEPLVYARPQAVVQREIYVLRYSTETRTKDTNVKS